MDPKEHLILFVDDEHASRVVFQQSFGKRFRVKVVDTGEKALDVIKEEPVAVLVTDQRMPGMSGDELLERVKAISPDTLRIVVTAYSDLEPILRAVNEGLVVRYIIKPWDRVELENMLVWALEVYTVGRTNSAVQLRLIQTERVLTLGQVTAAVIHDLKQPLAAIAVNLHELKKLGEVAPVLTRIASAKEEPLLDRNERRRLRELATELPEIAEELSDAAKFMNDVLMQLSQFRERELPPSEPADVDPVPLVRQAIAMCAMEARQLGCTIVNDTPTTLPRVRAMTAQVLQILINVIRNGAQASGRKARGGKVVVSATGGDDAVRFAIRDDGPGMSPEIVAKLGTPFFTTRPDGTGLGVAQVRRLVGSVGGAFDIDSAEGRGTTVSFTIPRSS
jgi:signal transduction histidine kinase